MKPDEAARLATRLLDAFPRAGATEGTVRIYAERFVGWDLAPASIAVERLIDSTRWLPSVAEVREAYAAAGGRHGYDPGRDMSPMVEHRPLTPDEQAAALEVRRRVRDLAAVLATAPNDGVGSEPTTTEGEA